MGFILSLARGHALDGRAQVALSGTDLVVGSSADCHWRIEGLATRHCQFGLRGGQWLLVDLGGGTVVNGRPLAGPGPIANGDMVTIGGCAITIADASTAIEGAGEALLAAAGLTRAQAGATDSELIAAAGALLRQLVAGLVDQLAARARAKADLGAEATQFAFGAANPVKTLPADRALAALLAPQAGTMPRQQAVAEVFADLDAHGAATLAGMQQALAATLERFSPAAIRARAQNGGLMTRVLPGAKEAALWAAYEREFDGVVKGSSDAFVELFAAEFARAYKAVTSAPRRPS